MMFKTRFTLFQQKMILWSLGIQASLSVAVMAFCMFEIASEKTTKDDSVLFSLLTATMSYWFPSPLANITAEGKEDDKHKDLK